MRAPRTCTVVVLASGARRRRRIWRWSMARRGESEHHGSGRASSHHQHGGAKRRAATTRTGEASLALSRDDGMIHHRVSPASSRCRFVLRGRVPTLDMGKNRRRHGRYVSCAASRALRRRERTAGRPLQATQRRGGGESIVVGRVRACGAGAVVGRAGGAERAEVVSGGGTRGSGGHTRFVGRHRGRSEAQRRGGWGRRCSAQADAWSSFQYLASTRILRMIAASVTSTESSSSILSPAAAASSFAACSRAKSTSACAAREGWVVRL